jgi:hypothetical protein
VNNVVVIDMEVTILQNDPQIIDGEINKKADRAEQIGVMNPEFAGFRRHKLNWRGARGMRIEFSDLRPEISHKKVVIGGFE